MEKNCAYYNIFIYNKSAFVELQKQIEIKATNTIYTFFLSSFGDAKL